MPKACVKLPFLLLLLGSIATGCDREAPEKPPVESASRALEVAYGGCAERRRGGLCELAGDHTLTLWTPGESGPAPELRIDGDRLQIESNKVAGGWRLRVVVPEGARTLSLTREDRRFDLSLAGVPPLPALEAARAARSEGRLQDAATLASSHHDSADPRLAAHALDLSARLAMQQGEAQRAVQLFALTGAAARKAGLRRVEAKSLLATAYLNGYFLFLPDAALRALEQVDPGLHSDTVAAQYHRAFIAFLQGDARRSLALCAEGRIAAERVMHVPSLLLISALELLQFAELGRLEEARAMGEQLLSKIHEPCDRADALTNVGWAELAVSAGDAERAARLSADAVSLYASDCPERLRRQNALINLALAHSRLGAFNEARARLSEAVQLGEPEGWVQAWRLELEGRLLLEAGRGQDALEVFDRMARRAARSATVSSRYRAQLGRGEVLVALGRLRDAADALELAEQALEEDARRVPLNEGRDVFAGDRDQSARWLVDVLLRRKEASRALFVARRARARALRTLAWRSQIARLPPAPRRAFHEALAEYQKLREALVAEEKEAWSVALDGLPDFRQKQRDRQRRAGAALDRAYGKLGTDAGYVPDPVAPGEQLLTFHPLPQGWVVFLRGVTDTSFRRLEALPPVTDGAALSKALLQPFAAEIRAAERLRVVPYGALKRVDFHALPFDGGMLLDALPVVYGVDLGAGAARPGARAAAVVADPRQDLPGARKEGELLMKLLGGAAAVDTRFGPEARLEQVRSLLTTSEAFHFAGHAMFEQRGWQSGLKLADAMLEPGDILSLPSVPRTVVLSGCETTRERGDVEVASIGVAQAFVARGSRAVIATTRPVPDTLGLALAPMLVAGGRLNLDPKAFRQAQLALRSAPSSGASWASYRLLVP